MTRSDQADKSCDDGMNYDKGIVETNSVINGTLHNISLAPNNSTQTDYECSEETAVYHETIERKILKTFTIIRDGIGHCVHRFVTSEVTLEEDRRTKRLQSVFDYPKETGVADETSQQKDSNPLRGKRTPSKAKTNQLHRGGRRISTEVSRRTRKGRPSVDKEKDLESCIAEESMSECRVYARWSDGCYYPGTVKRMLSNGRVEVFFDDSMKSFVHEKDVICQEVISVKSNIMVQMNNSDCYEPASVIEVLTSSPRFLVKTDSGSKQRVDEDNLMLTGDQVRLLDASALKFANVKTKGSKRRLSTINETYAKILKPSKLFNGGDEHQTNKVHVDGTIHKGIFQGITFILTTASRSLMEENSKQQDDTKEGHLDFDKKNIRQLIVDNGGVVLDNGQTKMLVCDLRSLLADSKMKTEDAQVNSNSPAVVLISNIESRTVKYLVALALNIPCLRHTWIMASIEQQKLLDEDEYCLPNGQSLESGEIIPSRVRRTSMFSGNRAVLLSSGEDFTTTCVSLLTSSDCESITTVHQMSDITSDMFEKSNFIISDITLNVGQLPSWLDRVKFRTLEWIIQSLICGQIRDPNSHPSYRWFCE